MELGAVGVKCEPPHSEPQFCHACFSMNRKLEPLHHNLGDFYDLIGGNTGTVVVMSHPWLCWECRSLLRRVTGFRRKAAAVQTYLHHYLLNKGIPVPPSLSTLGVAHSSKEISIEYKPQLGCPPSPPSDVKLELPATPPDQLAQIVGALKQELEDEIQLDDGDWQTDQPTPEDIIQKLPADITAPTKWCRKRRKPRQRKYIRRIESDIPLDKFSKKVPVSDGELRVLLERDRRDEMFVKYPHRCAACVRGWNSAKKLMSHRKRRHSMSAGPFECAICSVRLPHKDALSSHVASHYVARQCVSCDYRGATRRGVARHVVSEHLGRYQCRACGAHFHTVREFFRHDAALHRVFECERCGKQCGSRAAIVKHLAKHGPFTCQQCNGQSFKSAASLASHRALKHPPALRRPELAYCVECDKQFDSVVVFRKHLASAAAHTKRVRKKQIPCPVCGKIYARTTTMKAHYNYVHLKQSNYECRECDLLFLNRTKYVCHMRRRHEHYQPPRDKMCALCGRGFTTNRILENHVRTHTGERPFACTHCDAKFSQKTALNTHVKHIHLKVKRQSAQQTKYFD